MVADSLRTACCELAAAGYQHYEISNCGLFAASNPATTSNIGGASRIAASAQVRIRLLVARSAGPMRMTLPRMRNLRPAWDVFPWNKPKVVTRIQAIEEELFLGLRSSRESGSGGHRAKV